MGRGHDVIVDKNKCIGCGMCMKDCVAFTISIQNKLAVVDDKSCIACGHCEAICPTNAITLTNFDDESIEYDEQTRLDPDTLLMAIKTRRTIRQFTNEKVSEEDINKIIEAGRLAPTGGNAQKTSFIVIDKKKDEVEKEAVSMFKTLTNVGKKVIPFLKNMDIHDSFFFKNAPLVIVIVGDDVNASLAAENMAFMAEALGLGVLYSGFYTMVANHNRKVRKIMQMKRNEKAVTTLVIGYPAVRYRRTVKRENAKVRRV